MSKLAVIVFLKTLFVLLLILFGGIHLGPDEAQYWTWSQHLAPGYYSKPPGIAYQIFLGTSLFGNTELGVRFGSLLLGAITPFLIYLLAKEARFTDAQSFWVGTIWALSPVGFTGSFLAITDVGMIFFWTLACLILLKRGSGPLLGIIIACGALFKWPIYFFWVFALLYEGFSLRLISAMLISLAGLLPSLWWNIQHDFPTFKHVSATLQGGSGQKAKGNFFEFIGSQIALLSPLFFLFFLLAYRKTAPKLFLYISLPAILFGAIVSIFMKIQGNWVIFAYPTAACLAALFNPRWLKIGTAVSLLLIAAAFFLPYKMSPFKHNRDWDQIAASLPGYNPETEVLIGDKYQTTSLLSFYAPGQKQAYFLNLQNTRLNQFSFWPSLPLHSSGFFVAFDPASLEQLKLYFEEVTPFPPYDLGHRQAYIYKVTNYNGKIPASSGLY